jgi:DNA-binding HxlR family transcriptional regulator
VNDFIAISLLLIRDYPKMPKDSNSVDAQIMRVWDDEQYLPLLIDIVSHPKRLVSLREFVILNPSVSESEISNRLEDMQERGAVEKVNSSDSDTPRDYYFLSQRAREVFDSELMLTSEPFEEMFKRINHSDEFLELVELSRPNIDDNPSDLD